jgi:hypothetical protein
MLTSIGLKRGSGGRSITEFQYRFNNEFTAKTGTAKVLYSVDTGSFESIFHLKHERELL